jgi:hypothetical protein
MFALHRGQGSSSRIYCILRRTLDLCRDRPQDDSQSAHVRQTHRMAADHGTTDFRALADLGPNAPDLLACRMTALNLDPFEVREIAPQTFRDLRQICSSCRNSDRCLHNVASDPENVEWKNYCPNVETLMALNALPWTSRREW